MEPLNQELIDLTEPRVDENLAGLSEDQLTSHLGHHLAYYQFLKDKVIQGQLEWNPLQILRMSGDTKIYKFSAQYLYHKLYWNNLSSSATSIPETLKAKITELYRSFETFKTLSITLGAQHFSNGWLVWYYQDGGKFLLETFPDAVFPKGTPLLVLDLWEHSYYVDYRKDRRRYLLDIFNYVNWDKVEERLSTLNG